MFSQNESKCAEDIFAVLGVDRKKLNSAKYEKSWILKNHPENWHFQEKLPYILDQRS